jgi:ABC-type thiamin/hydroxymethylpyrimidine transport system permease subunit
MSFLDFVGEIFFFGIFFTPMLSFLLVRKVPASFISKIVLGLFMTFLLAGIFFVIALNIAFRNGLGPDSTY